MEESLVVECHFTECLLPPGPRRLLLVESSLKAVATHEVIYLSGSVYPEKSLH